MSQVVLIYAIHLIALRQLVLYLSTFWMHSFTDIQVNYFCGLIFYPRWIYQIMVDPYHFEEHVVCRCIAILGDMWCLIGYIRKE